MSAEDSPVRSEVTVRRRRWWLAAPVAVVLIGLAMTMGRQAPAEAPAKATPVLTVATETLVPHTLAQTLTVSGSVAAWEQLAVHPAANGLRIMALYADEGDRVQAGQLLAKLDDAALQAQYDAAKARLTNAEAGLAKMRQPNRAQDIATLEAALQQAEANVASAQDLHQRTQALVAQGAVSPAEATGREAALLAARAGAEQARQRLLLAREGSRPEDLRIAEAGLAAERANLRQIQVMLDQTRVQAPTSGLIIARQARLGDIASPGAPLFQLVRDHRYELQAQVPEADLLSLKPGMTALVTSDVDTGLQVKGKVRLISPAVDTTSRLGTVRIDLASHPRIKAGMFVRGRIELGDVSTLAVASTSVLTINGAPQVFVLDGDVARARRVELGVRSGERIAIRSGLQSGDAVITQGAGYLKDGDHVRLAPAASDAASAPAASDTAATAR